MSEPKDRRVKVETPVGLIVSVVLIALLVLGAILFAVYSSSQGIVDARMRGVIVEKEFKPQAEEQITIGEQGLRTQNRDGEYLLTVEVTHSDGTTEPYTVWLDKARYDAVKVGESFDVGPYLAP